MVSNQLGPHYFPVQWRQGCESVKHHIVLASWVCHMVYCVNHLQNYKNTVSTTIDSLQEMRINILYILESETSSTCQRKGTKYKAVYWMSRTANRIMEHFQSINGDPWHTICSRENCCFNLWLIGNAAANPREEREERSSVNVLS